MWRWQSLQEFQYPVMEYLATLRDQPLFVGLELVVVGHEHTSMSVITGQLPLSLSAASLPTAPNTVPGASRYTAVGNANALAQWSYCFDRGDTDISRGAANQWDCSFAGGVNNSLPEWNATAMKLGQGSGVGTGTKGHAKTVEAVKWMAANHPDGSYYVPAHLERAGRFNPDGNNGFNVEHLRNFNNAAPRVAFGMETQPGHGASQHRGEYQPNRLTIQGVLTDSVGTTTYGGTGLYGAQVGGLWDALLDEGRNFWFFASSDWHKRGSFGPDDRQTKQDFYPGEYQRNYTLVRNGGGKMTPQQIVDGLRSGNNFAASGQLIDRLAFIACVSYPGPGARSNAAVEALALTAAQNSTDIATSRAAPPWAGSWWPGPVPTSWWPSLRAAVTASRYVRLRGSNLPANVPGPQPDAGQRRAGLVDIALGAGGGLHRTVDHAGGLGSAAPAPDPGAPAAGVGGLALRLGARPGLCRRAAGHRPAAAAPGHGPAELQPGGRDRPVADGGRGLGAGALAATPALGAAPAGAAALHHRRAGGLLVVAAAGGGAGLTGAGCALRQDVARNRTLFEGCDSVGAASLVDPFPGGSACAVTPPQQRSALHDTTPTQ